MNNYKPPKGDKSYRTKPLGSVEKMVFESILSGKSDPHDVQAIARTCKLSEIQVSVALQLLKYKDLIR